MHRVPAPCTSNVWRIDFAEGETVVSNDEIVILESMKVEIPIAAGKRGKLVKLWVQEGEIVNQGEILFEIQPEEN